MKDVFRAVQCDFSDVLTESVMEILRTIPDSQNMFEWLAGGDCYRMIGGTGRLALDLWHMQSDK